MFSGEHTKVVLHDIFWCHPICYNCPKNGFHSHGCSQELKKTTMSVLFLCPNVFYLQKLPVIKTKMDVFCFKNFFDWVTCSSHFKNVAFLGHSKKKSSNFYNKIVIILIIIFCLHNDNFSNSSSDQLKSIHFKKTVAQSSFFSFFLKSKQSQRKRQHFWKKWGLCNCLLKMNGL